MKILYASPNIHHHMIPLATSIIDEIGFENFKYAILEPVEEERLKMKFDPNDENQPWTIQTYKSAELYQTFLDWFKEADVVLFSDRNLFDLAKKRLKKNKLTFYFSERWFKPKIGKFRLLHPYYLKISLRLFRLSRFKNFHYLAQGYFAPNDIKLISNFKSRIWNWGYFTDNHENKALRPETEKKIYILWCGRLLKWKRVDLLIKAFAVINKDFPESFLTIIGDGTEKKKIERLIEKRIDKNSYTIMPSQSPQKIREIMNSSDIYVLSSDGYEGWGAVINEAFAENCAIIASDKVGAISMIRNNKNGILFKSGNYEDLANKIRYLLNDQSILQKLTFEGKNSYNQNWTPTIAANRFITICKAILNNETLPIYHEGPMKKL